MNEETDKLRKMVSARRYMKHYKALKRKYFSNEDYMKKSLMDKLRSQFSSVGIKLSNDDIKEVKFKGTKNHRGYSTKIQQYEHVVHHIYSIYK